MWQWRTNSYIVLLLVILKYISFYDISFFLSLIIGRRQCINKRNPRKPVARRDCNHQLNQRTDHYIDDFHNIVIMYIFHRFLSFSFLVYLYTKYPYYTQCSTTLIYNVQRLLYDTDVLLSLFLTSPFFSRSN